MTSKPNIQLRITLSPETRLGPGKAALLQAIDETGSIAAAGRQMEMSYKRAWYLVETLNGHFDKPLVETVKGGRVGGGAQLTPLGEEILLAFREMQTAADLAIAPILKRLRRKAPSL